LSLGIKKGTRTISLSLFLEALIFFYLLNFCSSKIVFMDKGGIFLNKSSNSELTSKAMAIFTNRGFFCFKKSNVFIYARPICFDAKDKHIVMGKKQHNNDNSKYQIVYYNKRNPHHDACKDLYTYFLLSTHRPGFYIIP